MSDTAMPEGTPVAQSNRAADPLNSFTHGADPLALLMQLAKGHAGSGLSDLEQMLPMPRTSMDQPERGARLFDRPTRANSGRKTSSGKDGPTSTRAALSEGLSPPPPPKPSGYNPLEETEEELEAVQEVMGAEGEEELDGGAGQDQLDAEFSAVLDRVEAGEPLTPEDEEVIAAWQEEGGEPNDPLVQRAYELIGPHINEVRSERRDLNPRPWESGGTTVSKYSRALSGGARQPLPGANLTPEERAFFESQTRRRMNPRM